jgi:hypothetical protein
MVRVAAYELVLQFRGPAVETEDEVVEIEDVLFELLTGSETIDGHEVGAHARNISLLTADPRATFARMKPFLAQAHLVEHTVAAFRSPPAQAYTVIWPAAGETFSRT